jgi:hypothetical protein
LRRKASLPYMCVGIADDIRAVLLVGKSKADSSAILRSGRCKLAQGHGLVIKGRRIWCPPRCGHRIPQAVPRKLVESHGFDHGFPLIRSLRGSAQRSTSVLFSFVLSFIVAASFTVRQSKTSYGLHLNWVSASSKRSLNPRVVDTPLTVSQSSLFLHGHSCSRMCEGVNLLRRANFGFSAVPTELPSRDRRHLASSLGFSLCSNVIAELPSLCLLEFKLKSAT